MAVAEGATDYLRRRYVEIMTPMVMGLHDGSYSDEEKEEIEKKLEWTMQMYLQLSPATTRTQVEGFIQDKIYEQLRLQRESNLQREAARIIDTVFKHAPYTPKALR